MTTSVTSPRSAGVLLHPTSLPGPFGIGDLGPAAFAWIDALAHAKQTWWQILPLGPTGYGDSPYQCFFRVAGNPYLISPQGLIEDGLLDTRAVPTANFPAERVDFGPVIQFKNQLLSAAWEQFQKGRGAALKPALRNSSPRNRPGSTISPSSWPSRTRSRARAGRNGPSPPRCANPPFSRSPHRAGESHRPAPVPPLPLLPPVGPRQGIRQRARHQDHRRHSDLRLQRFRRRLGQPAAFSCSTLSAGRNSSPACPPITSARPASSGAIRITIGLRWRRAVSPGGSPAFAPPLASSIWFGWITFAASRRTGRLPREPQRHQGALGESARRRAVADAEEDVWRVADHCGGSGRDHAGGGCDAADV